MVLYTIPQSLLGIGGFASVLASVLAVSSFTGGFEGRELLPCLVITGFVFFLGLLAQIVNDSLARNLPLVLLEFILLLYSFEAVPAVTRRYNLFSAARYKSDLPQHLLERSLRETYSHLLRVATLFGAAYMIAIAVLEARRIVPSVLVLGDLTLYVVIVPISLALILVLREETSPPRM